jgi:hypothetical protein
MPSISIDRMTLELAGASESQARRLATGITERLAAADVSTRFGEFPAVSVNLTASVGTNADKLAEQVIHEILRELRRVL